MTDYFQMANCITPAVYQEVSSLELAGMDEQASLIKNNNQQELTTLS
jgi:hypothetical protein